MQFERQQILRAFADTLRGLRQRTGLAQEKLALATQVERTYVGGLESGQRNPSLVMICRLLPPLGVSFSEFAREFDKRLHASGRKGQSPR